MDEAPTLHLSQQSFLPAPPPKRSLKDRVARSQGLILHEPFNEPEPPADSDETTEDVGDERDGIETLVEQSDGLGYEALDSDAGQLIAGDISENVEPLVLWPPPWWKGGPEAQVVMPASISNRLLPHQREGVEFLYQLYREKRGGVLGDDMGLGKTIQAIAFLAAVLEKSGDPTDMTRHSGKQVLLLCPTSVLSNWKREFDTWGHFQVGIYHGDQREVTLKRVKAGDLEICMTSYDTYRPYSDLLNEVNWDCAILDEAHRLKNDASKIYQACQMISTRRRYGLTGTVLQNKYKELWCVFQWVAPGCMGTKKHFEEYYDRPLKLGQRINAPQWQMERAEERKTALLHLLRKHFLRRTKAEVRELKMKGKEDLVAFCTMSPLQLRAYRRVLGSPDFELVRRLGEPCDCGNRLTRGKCCHRTAEDGIIWRYQHRELGYEECPRCPTCVVLPLLQVLLNMSNHLELMKPDERDEEDKYQKDLAFAKLALGEDAAQLGGAQPDSSFMGLSGSQHCGKMKALEELLVQWEAAGDKVLLFSYSVRMLRILEQFLIRKGYSYLRLDGSTPMAARQALADEFNSQPTKFVFLISTRAGGTGLNLTGANRVVIFDPNWNPAHDMQAQDRSFRYGQQRHVTVYRLISAGSLEELVYNRQVYKQQQSSTAMTGEQEKRLYEGVMDMPSHKGELFGINNLFQEMADRVFTSDIVERHERIERIESDVAALAAKNRADLDALSGGGGRQEPEEDEHGLDELARLFQAEVLARMAGTEAQLVAEQEVPLPQFEADQSEVPETLREAGVVYAHRSEAVIGVHSRGRAAASWRREDAELLSIPAAPEKPVSGARRALAQAKGRPPVATPLQSNTKLPVWGGSKGNRFTVEEGDNGPLIARDQVEGQDHDRKRKAEGRPARERADSKRKVGRKGVEERVFSKEELLVEMERLYSGEGDFWDWVAQAQKSEFVALKQKARENLLRGCS